MGLGPFLLWPIFTAGAPVRSRNLRGNTNRQSQPHSPILEKKEPHELAALQTALRKAHSQAEWALVQEQLEARSQCVERAKKRLVTPNAKEAQIEVNGGGRERHLKKVRVEVAMPNPATPPPENIFTSCKLVPPR